jgi:hypothetical protein
MSCNLQLVKRLSNLVLTIVFGLCFCGSSFSQADDTEARAKDVVTRLANVQRRWGPPMNSPGVSLFLRRTSTRKIENHTAVLYRLIASGMPKDKIYDLYDTSFDLQPVPNLSGITFDDDGQAICAGTRPDTCGDPKKPNDPIDLNLLAARGEPKRLSLASEDGEIKAFVSVVPFPILGVDQGCTVEAILLMANAAAVLLHGSGFVPNTTVHFVADSEGEKQQGDFNVDADGSFYNGLLPYKAGKTDGTAKVTVTSQSCSPSLSFGWGHNSYQIQ